MQPLYVTLSSTGPSSWRLANWHATPQQIAFAVISTGGSSWSISLAYEDPTGVYPSPNSSAPTAFALVSGSANAVIAVPSSQTPIAAYQFNLNTQSSAGARVNFVALQSGIV